MPDVVRIGIVGTGFAERVQMPALAHVTGARLVAISSGHRENAERAARTFGIPTVCDDGTEVASRDDVDLVIISSPPHTHASVALAALAAGKHVLCEKPMALNVGQADAMVAAAAGVNTLSLIDHELRFNPTRRRARQLIADGYVGAVRHVSAVYRANIGRRHQAFTWWYQTSTGGGLLGAVGSHVIDTCRWWLGDIADVDCTLRTFVAERPDATTGVMRRVESDDFASLRMRSVSGVTIEASLSSVAPGPTEHRFEVVGSDGALVLDDERLTLTGWREDRTEDLTEPDPARALPGLINALWAPSFVHLAREVVAALLEGRTTVQDAATFSDGRAVQVVLDAARDSSARQAP